MDINKIFRKKDYLDNNKIPSRIYYKSVNPNGEIAAG